MTISTRNVIVIVHTAQKISLQITIKGEEGFKATLIIDILRTYILPQVSICAPQIFW